MSKHRVCKAEGKTQKDTCGQLVEELFRMGRTNQGQGYSDPLSSRGPDRKQGSVSSSPARVSTLDAVSGSPDYLLGFIGPVPPLTPTPQLSCLLGHFSPELLASQS